LTKM